MSSLIECLLVVLIVSSTSHVVRFRQSGSPEIHGRLSPRSLAHSLVTLALRRSASMDRTRSKLAASQQQQQQIRQQEMRRKALAADAEGGLDLPAVEGHASGVSPADTSTFQLIQFCAYHIRRSVGGCIIALPPSAM